MLNKKNKINNQKKIKNQSPFLKFFVGKEISYFLENLSSLLSAGMSITEALNSLKEEARSKILKKIIRKMKENIENGDSLSLALKKTRLFSPHVISLINIGEKSGNLIENLKVIAIEEEKRRKLTSKIRSASMYPIFVLCLTVLIGIGISWFILPRLAGVFNQLDIELPVLTRFLINFGQFLETNGLIAVIGFIASLILIIYIIFFLKATKIIGEHILFFLPGIKNVFKEAEIARFSYLLGTLLKAGASPTKSFYSLVEASSFIRYQKFYQFMAESIDEGNSFKKSFNSYKKIKKIIPLSVQQLIFAGEKSGTLADTLIKISDNYELKTETSAKNLAVMLEPILLLIVWLGVVMVALAVILPIYSLVGDFNVGL